MASNLFGPHLNEKAVRLPAVPVYDGVAVAPVHLVYRSSGISWVLSDAGVRPV
jgi:hypothetical protein